MKNRLSICLRPEEKDALAKFAQRRNQRVSKAARAILEAFARSGKPDAEAAFGRDGGLTATLAVVLPPTLLKSLDEKIGGEEGAKRASQIRLALRRRLAKEGFLPSAD